MKACRSKALMPEIVFAHKPVVIIHCSDQIHIYIFLISARISSEGQEHSIFAVKTDNPGCKFSAFLSLLALSAMFSAK